MHHIDSLDPPYRPSRTSITLSTGLSQSENTMIEMLASDALRAMIHSCSRRAANLTEK